MIIGVTIVQAEQRHLWGNKIKNGDVLQRAPWEKTLTNI